MGALDCYLHPLASVESAGFNAIQDLTRCALAPAATDVTNVDPLLAALADNGGSTETIALQVGSPAIGLVTDRRLCGRADQRGLPRTPPCDAGAYEAP